MTNEEAINLIQTAKAEVEWDYPLEYAEAFDKAINALEKQIPMKPIIDFPIPNNTSYKCPNCKLEIWALDENKVAWGHPQEFCEHCGQAIKGEDE